MKTLKIIVKNDSIISVNWIINHEDLNQYVDFEFPVKDDFKPFDHTFAIGDKCYSPCRLDLNENILVVKEFKIKGSKEDETNEDVLTCPVCGYIYHDCWEFPRDFESELECPMCKSILEYEREYEITYRTKVKKIIEPYKFKGEQCQI